MHRVAFEEGVDGADAQAARRVGQARARIDAKAWAYLSGGAADELTLRDAYKAGQANLDAGDLLIVGGGNARLVMTGAEILEQVGDRITHFVAALGTSGTAMGTTRRLREHHRKIVCVAAEPAEALHGLEGLKHMASSIVPNIYDPTLPDEILPVSTDSGWDMSDRLAEQEGLMVGHSSGANVAAALTLAKRLTAKGEEGCIVTIACDRHDRYFAPLKWEKKYVW